MKNILCIDFLNILYRSFYALPDMRNSANENIGALFSFIKILKKLLKDYNIHKIIICNDSLSIKVSKYPFYKNNRPITPADLLIQKNIVLEYLRILDIPVIEINGYEADDIIFSLAQIINEENKDVLYIVSGDKDLHGLLFYSNVYIIDHNKNVLLDKNFLFTKYTKDITQNKLFLYYSLCGDQSDNIKGVPGIGHKTAIKIITRYDHLEELYQNIDNDKILSTRILQLLLKNKQEAYDSFNLVHPLLIDKNILIPYLEKKDWEEDNFLKGNSILQKYECSSLIYKNKNINNIDLPKNESNITPYIYASDTFITKIVKNKEDIDTLILEIKKNNVISIDCETSSGDPQSTTVLGYSVCTQESHSWYIPLIINGEKTDIYSESVAVLNYIREKKVCVMHNALFDLHAISTLKIEINVFIFDTMIAAHIFREFKIGLKELSMKIFNQKMKSFSEIMEFGVYNTFDQVPLEKGSVYAATDARQTYLLYNHYQSLLALEENQSYYQLLYEIEMPLIKVLQHIESSGIYCNKNILINEEKKYVSELDIIKLKIKKIAEKYNISLNPMSNKQVSIFLYDILGLPHNKNKKTDQLTLSTIESHHEIVGLLLSYRSLSSNISHFTTGLQKYIKKDGKIYTHYQQYITNTGRITTMNPNLQNIPRTDNIYKIRNAFYAREKYFLVSFDYSQIELRVLAHLSKDSVLLDLFSRDADIHLLTAQMLFDKNKDSEVTSFERQIAKKVNFSIVYGQSAYNLAKDLKIKLQEARCYLEKFKNRYAGIFDWMDAVIQKTKKTGFVCTQFGMKRMVQEICDQNKNIFKLGTRIAINTIIQGTAAEIMKKAMINVYDYIKNINQAKIVLQIHDELLIELPESNIDNYILSIKSIMEKNSACQMPLKVNIKKEKYWE